MAIQMTNIQATKIQATKMQEQIDKAAALVKAAKDAGADAADAAIARSKSLSISVRDGKIENSNAAENADFTLRVFVGQQLASISANLNADAKTMAERAVAMAKASPINPYEALVEPDLLVQQPKDLDLYDDFIPDCALLTEQALKAEAAALSIKGVEKSGGAAATYGAGGLVLVTSNGFCHGYCSSSFALSSSAVAGHGTAMESDYDYTTALHHNQLDKAEIIGKNAGERAIKRLNARQAKTGAVDVIFAPRTARGIASHIAAMVNGVAVARKTSLLRNMMGQKIMNDSINIIDEPLKMRGHGSRPFDAEGVEGIKLNIVENGVLKNWLLSASTAKELGLKTNGHGVRIASSIQAASTNFTINPSQHTPNDLIKHIKTGFYVTDVFGHGVDLVSGQYSRGASGFWIENGEIAYPISEVMLGSNLLHMLAHLTPANDIDTRYATAAPTILIEGMTLAGK